MKWFCPVAVNEAATHGSQASFTNDILGGLDVCLINYSGWRELQFQILLGPTLLIRSQEMTC
jgi:hypothetical protein